jgi:hypothetical protein
MLERDNQFDGGSRILVTNDLSKMQIENLTTLGKIWGFLKYHHQKVTAGQIHWDYELFRVMPQILSARDRAAANAVLVKWIDGLGPLEPCEPCAKLDESDLYFRPEVVWITNYTQLGDQLSQWLEKIYEKRIPGQQFYVSSDPRVGNAIFQRELGYENLKLPDAGFQILALFRFWNIVEYWYPYRDLTGEKWDAVLSEFIPRVGLAKDTESYRQALMALIAKAHDGHANLWSSLQDRPPVGNCNLPVDVRFVEDLPVIHGISGTAHNDLAELKIGDVITKLDGVPLSKLIENWSPYYGASNDAARLFNVGKFLTRGKCGDTSIGIRRDGQELEFKVTHVPGSAQVGYTHDLPGPTFKLPPKDIAYSKLSSAKTADAGYYIQQASGTKGLIIDIRNYPSEFMVFSLGSHLVESDTPFARFTTCDLSNAGAFHWGDPVWLVPQKPHYAGKVVILVDESSMSAAEYTSMAFRAARGAIVVGSQTAGADGDVSPFSLPGGLRSMISGIGVFYPDKTPTHRIGIVPNVEIRPTIEGIREGRDEVLEEALRQILANHVPTTTIENLAKP